MGRSWRSCGTGGFRPSICLQPDVSGVLVVAFRLAPSPEYRAPLARITIALPNAAIPGRGMSRQTRTQTVGIYVDAWPTAGTEGSVLGKWIRFVKVRANPRDPGYMRELFERRYPEQELVPLPGGPVGLL